MSDAPIRLEADAAIAELILNRPDKRNALSDAMWSAIPGLIDKAVSAPAVKIVILHGGEAGAFAAGQDISEFDTLYANRDSAARAGRNIQAALKAVETCDKPVIAAIEGACVGGGASLALAADIRIAAETARFGVTPAKLGLVYPASDTRRLLETVGPSKAKTLLFTGKIIPADEAFRIGLADELAPAGEALAAARTMAEAIGAVSQWSTRAIKRMIAGLQTGWTDDAAESEALFLDGFENEDFHEGWRAFLEKRAARFTFR